METLRTRFGCLVRLTIGEQQFVTVSGTVTLAEPVRVQWLLASPAKPEAVQWEQLLSRVIITNGCRAGKRYMLPSACALPAAGGQSDALQSGRNVVHYMGIITIHPKGAAGLATEAKLRQLADKGCPVYYFIPQSGIWCGRR